MGGCATKPKVLKSDEAEVPAPAPAPAPELVAKEVTVVEDVVGGDEKKIKDGDGVGVVGGGDHEAVAAAKVKKIVVEDDRVAAAAGNDQESKPRSLSNLFKSEEEQDLTAGEEATSEAPVVRAEAKEIEKPKEESKKPIEVSEAKQPESEKLEALVEPMSPAFVDAPEKATVAEKAPEVAAAAPAVETLEIKETLEKFETAVETLEIKETAEKIKTEEAK